MTAEWPNSLPQAPLVGTFASQGQDNVVVGPSDVGEGARRRRASAVSEIVTFSLLMSLEQVRILKNFYDTDLGGGVYRFAFPDPISGESKDYSFSERYQVQHEQADIYRVTLKLMRKAE